MKFMRLASEAGPRVTASWRARAVLLVVALLGAAAGLTGCLGAGPDKQAQAALSSALDELATRPALHYRGVVPGSKPATRIDVRVTRGGIALGTVRLGPSRVRVLALDGKRFVRGDAAFWVRNGVFQPSLARTYGRRWVQIGPRNVRGMPPLRTPAQLAAWLRRTADPEAAQASEAQVGGVRATRIDIGDGAVYVTATKPHRVVRVQAAESSPPKTKTASIRAGVVIASAGAGSDPAEPGIDVSQPDAEEFDDLIDDVKDETRKLDTAVDSGVQFTNAPAFSCSNGGTCTASNTVSNVVTAEGRARGRVDATLNAAITARGVTKRCSDSRSMAPNSSASLSCSASFPVPRTRMVIPVVGNLHMTARADVDVARLERVAERERTAGRPCNCFPAGTRVKTDRGDQPIDEVRVGDRVWARDLSTGRGRLRRVTTLFSTRTTSMLTLAVGARRVQVTPQHPFWARGRGWVSSGSLAVGDELQTFDRRWVGIDSVASRRVATTVYNFEVEGDHNYFASDAQLLVHNCDPNQGALSAAGRRPAQGGRTAAGRAYQKHMDRGELPRVDGRALDDAGQRLLDDILTNPGSEARPVTSGNAPGGVRVIRPDGLGVTFRADGSLAYFGGGYR